MTRTQEIDLAPRGGLARRLPLLAGSAPVAGALLSWHASGYVHALVAGETFAGICTRSVRPGGYLTDGLGQVDAMTGQFLLSSTGGISGIDATDVAAATVIYASDDSTLTETAGSNTKIGAVAGFDGSRVVIMARTADVAAADAPPPTVITLPVGNVTFVDTVNGSDATGTPGDQALPYKTIQAAIDDSVAGDLVWVWPGTYAEGVELKTGVNLHGTVGARIAPASGGNCLSDIAVACDATVSGHFRLTPSGGGGGVRVSNAGSYVRVECEYIDVAGNGHAIRVGNGVVVVRASRRIDVAAGSNVFVESSANIDVSAPQFNNYGTEPVVGGVTGTVNLRASMVLATGGSGRFAFPSGGLTLTADIDGDINVATGVKLPLGSGGSFINVRCARFIAETMVVQITSGAPTVNIIATQEISANRILVDSGSTGATRVSIRSPSITATEAGQEGVSLAHSAAARYDIDADVLRCCIANRIDNPASELHINGRSMQSHAGSGGAGLNLQKTGKTFLHCDEMVGIAGAPEPIYMQESAELHILGGRIRGLNGDAGGHAILTSGGTVKLRLYPGTVLIAGSDAATESISADSTPTVLCMGDIAANKAANVGVVEAVGSLLVDAAVV